VGDRQVVGVLEGELGRMGGRRYQAGSGSRGHRGGLQKMAARDLAGGLFHLIVSCLSVCNFEFAESGATGLAGSGVQPLSRVVNTACASTEQLDAKPPSSLAAWPALPQALRLYSLR
jgi:hypothetical protein